MMMRARRTRRHLERKRRRCRTLYARHVEISPTYHFPEVCNREKGEWQRRTELSKFGFIRRAASQVAGVNGGGRCFLNICISRCRWKNIRECIRASETARGETVSFTLCTLSRFLLPTFVLHRLFPPSFPTFLLLLSACVFFSFLFCSLVFGMRA